VIEDAEHRLVAIIDPRIKADEAFFVYSEGNTVEDAKQTVSDIIKIFINDSDGAINFVSKSWPGKSS